MFKTFTRIAIFFVSLVTVISCVGLMHKRSQVRSSKGIVWADNVRKKPIPSFHASAPREPLPSTLNPSQFTDPVTQTAYKMASKVRAVLYQEPCYCGCDTNDGHKSLLDCYTTKHASECDICRQEGIYVYEQVQKGKKTAEIRSCIIRGDWKKIDLKKYETFLTDNRQEKSMPFPLCAFGARVSVSKLHLLATCGVFSAPRMWEIGACVISFRTFGLLCASLLETVSLLLSP